MTKRVLMESSNSQSAVGFYQSDLNPAIGLPAGGHDPHPVMSGFYDRLYAKSISLLGNGTRVVITSVDLVGVSKELCDDVREEISKLYGIPSENVIILATHTHSAPETNCWGIRWFYPTKFEADLLEFQRNLKESIIWSITQAIRSEKPLDSLSFSRATIPGLYTNRNDPNREIDDTVESLLLKSGDPRRKCLVFNQHNHPTILGLRNTSYSAEFPGTIARRLEETSDILQSNCVTGACGDVSIRQVLGNEFSDQRIYQNILKYGSTIADSITRSLEHPTDEIRGLDGLRAKSKVVRLKLKSHPTLDEAESLAEELQKQSSDEVDRLRRELGLYGMKMWIQTLKINDLSFPDSVEMEFGAVYFGDDREFVLVWAPGEILSKTGLGLKKISRYKHTFLSGYGNGYLGYFATPESHRNLEYEANFTPLSEEAYFEIEKTFTDFVQE